MDKFERLNRETREWNNSGRYRESTNTTDFGYTSLRDRINRFNNETYKYNNGQYNNYYK